jgi:plasmid stabilization system protein ParE
MLAQAIDQQPLSNAYPAPATLSRLRRSPMPWSHLFLSHSSSADGVQIVRVLHGARDIEIVFTEPEADE